MVKADPFYPSELKPGDARPYLADFCPAARGVLTALAGFEPPWSLSGRAALWWLPVVTATIAQVDLVWHGAASLGTLPGEILRALAAARLDAATLHGDSRRTWLAVRAGESACLLKLTAEPAPPVEPPWRATLYGSSFLVEARREVLAAALCSLAERPDLQDLEDVSLLLRTRASLDSGLRDARRRSPGLSPFQLACRLASFEVEDPDRPAAALAKLRRFRERLVCEVLARGAPDSRAS
jgi:hypothetical protein